MLVPMIGLQIFGGRGQTIRKVGVFPSQIVPFSAHIGTICWPDLCDMKTEMWLQSGSITYLIVADIGPGRFAPRHGYLGTGDRSTPDDGAALVPRPKFGLCWAGIVWRGLRLRFETLPAPKSPGRIAYLAPARATAWLARWPVGWRQEPASRPALRIRKRHCRWPADPPMRRAGATTGNSG